MLELPDKGRARLHVLHLGGATKGRREVQGQGAKPYLG